MRVCLCVCQLTKVGIEMFEEAIFQCILRPLHGKKSEGASP